MMDTVISIGFGSLAIAMGFLVFIFFRAYGERGKRDDRRYRVVAGALTIDAIGVGLWALNPLSQSFGGPPLHPVAMSTASGLILIGAFALVGSTAMGGSKRLLKWFLLACVVWVAICIAWSVIA